MPEAFSVADGKWGASAARAPARLSRRNDLYPVLLKVPDTIRQLRGRLLVRRLSRLARMALHRAALRGSCPKGPWIQDDLGVPQPTAGFFWSISHKTTYVAGVVAPHPVGIDLEPILPRSTKLHAKIAAPAEWQLRRDSETVFFYRLWTAKEAVLKAEGIGLRGLSRCRLVAVRDDTELTVAFEDRQWNVRQFWVDGHLASVTASGGSVEWLVDAIRRSRGAGG